MLSGLTAGATVLTSGRQGDAGRLAVGERLAKDQTLRAGGGGYFPHDPASHDFSTEAGGLGHPALFAGLMRFDADFVAVPHLATRVERKQDGSVWIFRMRHDARWSNGAPCTAHDFVWSWTRKLDPASRAPYATFLYDIKNAEAFNKGQLTDPSRVGLRVRDDHTLEVTLEGPRAYFPALTAFTTTLPAYRPAVERHGTKWTEAGNIVCNGPFVLESWDHHRQFVLRKNPLYYDAASVILERIIVPIIPLNAGLLPYENNEVDFSLVPPGHLRRVLADPELRRQVFRYPRPQTWYLIPQANKSPFDDLRVRRAVSHAIDREAIAQVANGAAIPAHSMIPPGVPGHIEDPRIRDIQRFDPATARAELRGTRFDGGRNWPPIVMGLREQGEASKPMAEAIQAMLAEHLGMAVELQVLEPKAFYGRLWKQDFHLVWIRWSTDYPDPHNEYFDTFYGKGSPTSRRQAWANDTFDRLLELARGELDEQKRATLYRRAEEVLQTDVGYVPVVWGTPYAVLKPWVRGVERNRLGEMVVDSNFYVHMLAKMYIVAMD
jgi:oligopeptide transport system substrate-binding protein